MHFVLALLSKALRKSQECNQTQLTLGFLLNKLITRNKFITLDNSANKLICWNQLVPPAVPRRWRRKWAPSSGDRLHPPQKSHLSDTGILHLWCSTCPCIPDSVSKKLARHEPCSSSVQAAQMQKSILAEPVGLEQCLDEVQPTSQMKNDGFGLFRSTLQNNEARCKQIPTEKILYAVIKPGRCGSTECQGWHFVQQWSYVSGSTQRLRHFHNRISKFLCYYPSQQWFY